MPGAARISVSLSAIVELQATGAFVRYYAPHPWTWVEAREAGTPVVSSWRGLSSNPPPLQVSHRSTMCLRASAGENASRTWGEKGEDQWIDD